MKNLILLICFVSTSFGLLGQTKYEKGMKKAFELWQQDKVWDAANMFERIAQAEPDQWLPSYYVSQINVIKSFGETDETVLTAQLKKALDFLNDTKAIAKEDPNVMVLEAQYYTAWIAYDGQQYGMKYSGKVAQLYQQAAALAPENPIVLLGKAEWDIGAARFFGQSTEPYCKDLERAAELFTTFKPETEFHPSYGAERVQEVIKTNCNK